MKTALLSLSIIVITLSSAYAEPDPNSVDQSVKTLVNSEENLENTEDKLKQMEEALLSQLNSNQKVVKETEVVKKEVVQESPKASLKTLEEHLALETKSAPKKVSVALSPSSDDDLKASQKQVRKLSSELETARKNLASAERRIDELSYLVRSSQTIQKDPGTLGINDDVKGIERFSLDEETRRGNLASNYLESVSLKNDSDVALVSAKSTPLRISPNRYDSVLFDLPRDSRVAIERRTGEWFRVVTDSGARGWVYAGAVTFYPVMNHDSTVRIRGFSARYEPIRPQY